MTQPDVQRTWVVLGGLHLDLSADIEARWLRDFEDNQTWVTWRIDLGGVGGNIARFMAEIGEDIEFVAIVGEDPLGDLLLQTAMSTLPNVGIHKAIAPHAATGIVSLLFVEEGAERRRLVIGPTRSAVDAITYLAVDSILGALRRKSRDLIFDGYLLRDRVSEWVDALREMKGRDWRVHLELVPHNIWRTIDSEVFGELLATCATISASLSTVERIIRVQPDDELEPRKRARRFLDAIEPYAGANAQVMARFGYKDAEFCIRALGRSEARLWHYDRVCIDEGKGNQDRVFVLELAGRTDLVNATGVPL